MSNNHKTSWFNDFLGVAYRYYDLRMNVVPLFEERKNAADLWHKVIHFWVDPSIKIRFVESGDKYWFVMASETKNPDSNQSFFKVLAKSENYERFKNGHDGEAYLRLGVYSKKYFKDVKGDAPKNCENWCVMINSPNDSGQDWDSMIDKVRINVIKKINKILNVNIEDYIECEKVYTPKTIESNTQSYMGSLYGSSSNNLMSAFLRHPNFSNKILNLYFYL